MNKKLLLIVLGLVLVVAGVSIFYFLKKGQQTSVSTETGTETKSASKKEEIVPTVTEYKVPILMYHYIRDASGETDLGKKLSVNPSNFDNQIKYLKENGYETILVSDLADPNKKAISRILHEKKKPIALTFDDGYDNAYTEALPILKKYGFNGTFYIIRNYVTDKGFYMSQKQIDELAKAGNEIGSHTLSHPNLETLSETDQRKQIFDSKQKATTFCYPSGKYNETTLTLVKKAGYVAAVTTQIGIVNEKTDLFQLPRVRVEDTDGQALKEKIDYAYEHSK